jgi:phage FluMu gp28-like protein
LKTGNRKPETENSPSVLLPYQQRWTADVSPVKVWEKSRRIGASWGDAADSVLLAASKNGMDTFYIGYNKDMAQEYIDDCAKWARQYHKIAVAVEEVIFKNEGRDGKDIMAFRINFASGHKILALSSRPANLRGKQGKIVIDEAAFHDDLAGLLKAALAMLIWGGRVEVISTHNGDDNPFNELVTDIRAGKKRYSLHRTTIDDALTQGLYQRICLTLGGKGPQAGTPVPLGEAAWRQELFDLYGDDAEEELLCIPASSAGAYLTRALIESCMDADIPVVRWSCKADFAQLPDHVREAAAADWLEENVLPLLEKLPQGRPCYFGEDFGRSGDLTVIWPMQESQTLVCRTPFVVELRNVPFRQQEQILFFIVDRLPIFRGGALDARGNGQFLAEVAMQRYGEGRISQVMLSNSWYLENMPKFKAALEDKTFTMPRDGDILDDHRALRVEKGIPKIPDGKKALGRDGGQRHGDSAIAACLAVAAKNLTPYQPVEYETLKGKRFMEQRGAW